MLSSIENRCDDEQHRFFISYSLMYIYGYGLWTNYGFLIEISSFSAANLQENIHPKWNFVPLSVRNSPKSLEVQTHVPDFCSSQKPLQHRRGRPIQLSIPPPLRCGPLIMPEMIVYKPPQAWRTIHRKKKKGHNNGESVRVTPYAAVFNSDISMGQRNNKILRKSIYILTL